MFFACTVVAPWAADGAASAKLTKWAKYVADSVPDSEGSLRLVVGAQARTCAPIKQWASAYSVGKPAGFVTVVEVNDMVYSDPASRVSRGAYTIDELRGYFGCEALLRTRILIAAQAAAGQQSPSGSPSKFTGNRSRVWFAGFDCGEPEPTNMQCALETHDQHPDACVTRGFKKTQSEPRQLMLTADQFKDRPASADTNHYLIIGEDVLFCTKHGCSAARAAAVRVTLGTFDWALATIEVFAAAPMKVAQFPVKSIVLTVASTSTGMRTSGHSAAAPLAGVACGWFMGASEAGIPVFGVCCPTE
jgi:hypothetical protein